MRDFARAHARRLSEEYAATDRHERARDRLLCHYQTATEAADGILRGLPPIPVPQDFTGRDGALAWLDAERPSLLAATRMAADVRRDHAATSLPLLMAYYLDFRGLFDDLLAATTIGLGAARRLGDRAAQGEALNNLGSALVGLERYDEALSRYREAAMIFRQAGNRRAEAESSANLAIALTGMGRYDQALTGYQDALAVLRLTGDQHAEGAALNNLGIALRALRRYDEARTAYQDAVAIFWETGDRHGLAMTLGNLGNVLRTLGRSADAAGTYQEAASIFRETGDRPREEAAIESFIALQRTA
jgi:tetratricopeptide (TPR) repeat protein